MMLAGTIAVDRGRTEVFKTQVHPKVKGTSRRIPLPHCLSLSVEESLSQHSTHHTTVVASLHLIDDEPSSLVLEGL